MPETVTAISFDAKSPTRRQADRLTGQGAAAADDFAPFVLLRIASLPLDSLDRMLPVRTLAAIGAADAAEQTMAYGQDRIVESLFDLVGRTRSEDGPLRRAILQLKREVYALARPKISDDRLAEIIDVLSPADGEALQAYRVAAEARDLMTANAEQYFTDELQTTIRPALRATLKEPLFTDALALASPSIAAHAMRERRLPTKPTPDQFERSLLNYLIRTSVKTSPFSTFMATMVVPVETGEKRRMELSTLVITRRCRLNRGVVTAILNEQRISGRYAATAASINPTLRHLGAGRAQAVVGRYHTLIGRPWRQTLTVYFRLAGPILRALTEPHQTLALTDWRARLERFDVPAHQSKGLIDTFVERGILNMAPVMDAFDADLPSDSAFAGDAFAVALTNCDALRAGASGPDRLRLLKETDRIIERELTATVKTGQSQVRNTVLEDCWADTGSASLSYDDLAPLEDLQAFLADQIEFAPDHVTLRRAFTDRFGAGGRCSDVLAFFLEAEPLLSRTREYGAEPSDTAVTRAPAGSRMPLTVQYQEIADSAPGEPILVTNKVFEGVGWLSARHAFGDSEAHRAFRTRLTAWLATVAGDREPVDVPVCGECNDLQAHPRLTERVITLPGEPFKGDGGLALADLRIVDNEEAGVLRLEDADGRALEPFYLGGSLPSPTWGFAYTIAVLSRPFRLLRPPFAPPKTSRDDISLVPRTIKNRVMIKRATWWLGVEYLQRAWFAHSGAARLRAVRRECEANGLPSTFYARRPLEASDAAIGRDLLKAQRKPLYIDVGNPFCLDLLEQLTQDIAWISFTEAVPVGEGHAVKVGGRTHVAELQTEMIVCAQ